VETLRQDFAVLRCVDWNSDSFIKNVKFAFPVGIRELLAVDVNAAVELGNVFESFFLEKGSCCFTTDSTSAVGDNFFVFVLAEFLVHDFRKLFEVLHRQGDGVFEAADFIWLRDGRISKWWAMYDPIARARSLDLKVHVTA